jgi:Arc/MetJ-type ribon-helix-helix transcriptional regulator
MEPESAYLVLPANLYRQFNRLKNTGQFQSDADVLQASLTALEQQWAHHRPEKVCGRTPYMSRPPLSIEDYDT